MTFRRTKFFGTLVETFSEILVGFLYGSKLVLRYEIGLTGQVDPGIRGIICVLFLVPFLAGWAVSTQGDPIPGDAFMVPTVRKSYSQRPKD